MLRRLWDCLRLRGGWRRRGGFNGRREGDGGLIDPIAAAQEFIARERHLAQDMMLRGEQGDVLFSSHCRART